MIIPIQAITYADAQRLRRKIGTNGRSVIVTKNEVEAMKQHLDTIYPLCDVTYTFAEKIVRANKCF